MDMEYSLTFQENEEQIFIGVDNQVVELTGANKEAFLADRAQIQTEIAERQTKLNASIAAKESAINKLSTLGLTEEEIKALVGA
jgi:hypothetical protein